MICAAIAFCSTYDCRELLDFPLPLLTICWERRTIDLELSISISFGKQKGAPAQVRLFVLVVRDFPYR